MMRQNHDPCSFFDQWGCVRAFLKTKTTGVLEACMILAILISSPANAQEVVGKDDGTFVIDDAGIFSAEKEQQLEVWLKELETKTQAQLKVFAIKTTGSEDIFSFAQRTATQWKLGGTREDDGVLIVLATNDRKVRIQTGYGIESILPDSWCGTQSRDVAQTYFKQQRYADGLTELALVRPIGLRRRKASN